MSEQPRHTNRLKEQKSPYLLQHAHNPVDWYPWGEEAFAAARDLDKPIFLSIGYATCHWCHVMEKESFEDLEIAQLLNESFISIKVDREELPEVDSLYMEFAQSMMSGAAGWPLNVVLTPALRPFFATTYLPPIARHGLMGFKDTLLRLQEVWADPEEKEDVQLQADKIVEVFSENIHTEGSELPSKELVEVAAELMFKLADPVYGGIKGAPKFPIGYQTNFMLREASELSDGRALFLVERTLDMMNRGGIYDHLGGGFSRYSVDERWLVPHFEKMLYDNAILAFSYLEGWQGVKKELFKDICCETLDYILREMTDPEGGFYSAEDADSEGMEGYYYTWLYDDIIRLLGDEESVCFNEYYGVTPEGNFEGRNILNTVTRIDEFAKKIDIEESLLKELLYQQKEILFEERKTRVPPFKDDKILTAWNGLAIFSFIEAGRAFGELCYVEAAVKAATFIRDHMQKEGQLLRRWREGEALYNAGIDEHAYLIRALISLFEADCGVEWLIWACRLTDTLSLKFKSDDGAFYQTNGEDPNIILRQCQFADGAEPSGNAVQCENLIRLYQLTWNPRYLDEAEDILRAVRPFVENYAPGYCYHMIALDRYYDKAAPTYILAVPKGEDNEVVEEILEHLYSRFLPHKAVIVAREGDIDLQRALPHTASAPPQQGEVTLYLCREGVCSAPLIGSQSIMSQI